MKAVLVLEDGTYYTGESFGARGDAYGEVVFNTCMTGYQEVVTDPSYNGQMVCMTYPLIGNYGMNPEDAESSKTHIDGFIVKELCDYHSNFRADISPEDYFSKNGITGIKGVDTRAITQHIRRFGSMYGVISTHSGNISILLEKLLGQKEIRRDLVGEVTTGNPFNVPGDGPRISLLDFGAKSNIIRSLSKRNCDITVYPAATPAGEVLMGNPDGIVLSNGPGDPRDLGSIVSAVRELADSGIPVLGICLGHQLLALALEMGIYKLKFGHHGGNHPVKDLSTGRCHITSQNHNYAVSQDSIPAGIEITHVNANDKSIEGFCRPGYPIISVQYHPEASPGPEDSAYIFDDFIKLVVKGRQDA
ncbi:MAG: glutamine-hydrolyzing carbamoyl-phosphate synthase small subunit [Clostridia bacterium]|nr:glutamine-hydrolyzing carbamoyl-phosphate synthase small subunit [Clostridia bacterium]